MADDAFVIIFSNQINLVVILAQPPQGKFNTHIVWLMMPVIIFSNQINLVVILAQPAPEGKFQL